MEIIDQLVFVIIVEVEINTPVNLKKTNALKHKQ